MADQDPTETPGSLFSHSTDRISVETEFYLPDFTEMDYPVHPDDCIGDIDSTAYI